MKARWMVAAPLALTLVGLSVGEVSATTPTAAPVTAPTTAPTTKILAKSTFDELNIRAVARQDDFWRLKLKTQGTTDGYVVDNTFAPGADTGWHSHPGPSLVFVVSGTMTNYSSDGRHCTTQVYPAGSTFVDEGGSDVHNLRNESAAPAETIAVQLLPSGAARKSDRPAPSCSF